MSPTDILCPICGAQLASGDGGQAICEGSEGMQHPPHLATLPPPDTPGYPGGWRLVGDDLVGPWRYKQP
jgi:hypothetical protein